MTTTKAPLFKRLQELGITFTEYIHEPLFTVEQSHTVYDTMKIPGARCKNLFLKDSKKRFYLVVALADTKIDLKQLRKQIDAPELRFADAQLLNQYLGVEPGSVTPFGLIHDTQHAVIVILDQGLFEQKFLTFHPLKNDATLVITPHDLLVFIKACGNQTVMHQFDNSTE